MTYRELYNNAQELTVIARDMKREGMPVDQGRREAHRIRLTKEREKAETSFRSLTSYAGKMGDDEGTANVFFSDKGFGIPPILVSDNTGLPSLDKGVLRALLGKSGKVRLAAESLLSFRQAHTTESRYIGQGFLGEPGAYGLPVLRSTGRHHPTFGVCAAETQRFTCQGGAHQTQKDTLAEVRQADGSYRVEVVRPGTRNIFRAPPGWVWLEADYAALELRLFALYANIPRWLEGFSRGLDVHKENTAIALKKPVAGVLKQERDVFKTCTFGGIAYGGDAATVHAQVVNKYPRLTVEMIEEFKRNIFNAIPEIPAYHDAAVREAMLNGRTELATGDAIVWKFPDADGKLFGEYKPTEIINQRMQRTAAQVMNRSLVRVARNVDKKKTKLVLQLHDAAHALVRDDSIEQEARKIKESMETSLFWQGREIVLSVEVKAGPSWGEQKEIKI